MTGVRKLTSFRKLYPMHVEYFDLKGDEWIYCGLVLLPDNAYRDELAHVLMVFGIHVPRGADRISWSYASLPGDRGPLPWPRVRVTDTSGLPLVRLVSRPLGFRDVRESRE